MRRAGFLRPLACSGLIALATSGCAAEMQLQELRAKWFPPRIGVEEIHPGVTTQQQVRAWFGEPDAISVDYAGAAHWGYAREVQPSRIQQVFQQTDRWVFVPVRRFANEVVYYPPKSPPKQLRETDQLAVSFGPDGVVTQFAYRRAD